MCVSVCICVSLLHIQMTLPENTNAMKPKHSRAIIVDIFAQL